MSKLQHNNYQNDRKTLSSSRIRQGALRSFSVVTLLWLSAAGPGAMAADNIAFNGVIETEYGSSKAYDGSKESGFSLATVEFGIDSSLNANADGHILVLHEDGDTEPWEVDEAFVDLHDDNKRYHLAVGRMYVGFGHFDSSMVSDPLTLELGETREAAISVAVNAAGFGLSAFAYNGDTIETADVTAAKDTTDQYGYAVSWEHKSDSWSAGVGASWMNNIADSDGFTSALPAAELVSYVPGYSAYLNASFGPVTLIAETVAASDEFDVAEIAWQTRGAKPGANNVELAVTVPLAGKAVILAAAQQTTTEALALGLPETRAVIAARLALLDNIEVAVETLRDEDYSLAEGGSGEQARTTTVQMALSF